MGRIIEVRITTEKPETKWEKPKTTMNAKSDKTASIFAGNQKPIND